MEQIIRLAHGSGGKLTHNIINEIFHKEMANDILLERGDSAILESFTQKIAFTTDSYVITPTKFKGGDIGKISVCGTVNDLAVSGAEPLYLTCAFIIEEGLLISELKEIVKSMAKTCKEAGVKIVTGDTKVVPKGAADKIFINTAGIGKVIDGINYSSNNIKKGDKVIITGTLGDHESTILLEREKFNISADLKSDCAPLNIMLNKVSEKFGDSVRIIRDATRGGLGSTLNEFVEKQQFSILLDEDSIPLKPQVRGICEMLGLDPMYMANEGKAVLIVGENEANNVVDCLKNNEYGEDSKVIGEVVENEKGRVFMKTLIGGHRIIDMLVGEQLPRIC